MRSLNEILLPTDFALPSVEVAHYASALARHFGSRLTLLNVLPPINPAWAAMLNSAVFDEVLTRQKEETIDRLNKWLAAELQGLCVKRLVLEGDPAEVITEYAASDHVELIVMATRGCEGFRRFLLGSVTAKVLHDVGCPVLTGTHTAAAHPLVSVIPKVIVCAVGSGPEAQRIVQWASELAVDLQAVLVVTHAIPSLEVRPETYFLEADMRRALMADERARVIKLLEGSRTPDARVRVEGGNVSTVVRSVIEDCKAGLLIIGRSSKNGPLGRLRTHSYALIRESLCPVLSI